MSEDITLTKKETNSKQPELGMLDKQAEIILRIVPVALAGGGPVTQTTQIDEWLNLLNERYDVPVRRLGVAGHKAEFVDEQITGTIYPLDRLIQPATSISDIYHSVSIAVAEEIHYLYARGIRHFASVCCGYTSYGLFALQQVVGKLNKANPDDPITGNIIIQDSSFPDTDNLSTKLDSRSYPTTRFYGSSYQSTSHLRIIFTLNGAIPFDVALSNRVPDGCIPIMTSLPYTPRYIEKWQEIGEASKVEARRRLLNILPGWNKIKSTDWVVPFLASDIWDADSVGKWLTLEQYNTVVEGTLAIVNALCLLSEKTDRPIFLPLIRQGADWILSQNIVNVFSVDHQNSNSSSGVVVVPYDTLVQSSFIDLIGSANLVINRSVQSNAFVETIFAGTPQLVITIPAAGYMENELMAQGMKEGLLKYNHEDTDLSTKMYDVLTKPDYQTELVNSLQVTFDDLYSNSATNFGSILIKAAGLG